MKFTIAYCLLLLVVASQAQQWRNNYDAGSYPSDDIRAPSAPAYPAEDYPAPFQPYTPPKHYKAKPGNPVLYREIPVPLPIPAYPASVILPSPPYPSKTHPIPYA
ncbi:hypothetical protein DAPPUDRAFT_252833 [Daphnia pulex]|uniref:Uncharacterized protein n=1 Tax=Daphnia pulex TaxID=6669 RepID=E9H3K8_DAPPU|nr:hypothetical protein DAPPUDRAFT_252833 [Daphnia pulex]|eukprot:EFX73683.1 hypothetical protein DAPPUDRAFT_252833 [Daphnia pulex]